MKKTNCLILCLILICNFAGAQISGNIANHNKQIDSENISYMTDPSCAYCSDNYMRTGMTVEIYTESGHHKGTYSVWLGKGDKYIKFNDEWIRIEGKSRFLYHGNAYMIKKSS